MVGRRRGHVGAWRVGDGQRQGALRTRRPDDTHDVRRGTRLADAHHEGTAIVRGGAVERVDARRGEPHVHARQHAQRVLGIDGSVVGRASRGDHDVTGVGGAHHLAEGRDLRCRIGQEACHDLRLLSDLVDQAHRSTSMPWPRA